LSSPSFFENSSFISFSFSFIYFQNFNSFLSFHLLSSGTHSLGQISPMLRGSSFMDPDQELESEYGP